MLSGYLPDMTLTATVLAAWLPLVAFLAIITFLRPYPRVAAGISLAAVTVALACALLLLIKHAAIQGALHYTFRWVSSGGTVIPIGFLLDPLSLLMMAVVAVICFLVQIYSLGYMAGDPGVARYYAFMSLFVWAMLNLTLAATLIQLYVFWELVGVSSYLLIGFWFEKFSASEAGKKAFVMTRLGDVAFFLGLLLLLFHLGNLNIQQINDAVAVNRMPPAMITVSALLIFCGIIGKSAQFPLLTWLPDAMEGPTPVSALLHSATMVAAGVFLFARLFPFFSLSPTAMTVCLAIGTISLLLSSTMAMVSRDIKQVWAYSTISQLGFMIMGLAAGGYSAGVFHLTTHAGFKALLFLCSGVFIHSYGSNDMFVIGRQNGRRRRIPMICMLVAAAALSGVPPFSGFFSKEMILADLAGLPNPMWLAAGLLGAFLTAYYTFRLIFIIVFPRSPDVRRPHHENNEHAGAYRAMHGPLLVLALVTAVLGFGQNWVNRFLSAGMPAEGTHHGWLPPVAIGLALAGIGLAWFEFARRHASQEGFAERVPALKKLFSERWYIDRFYRLVLDAVVYKLFSGMCTAGDRRVIDPGLDELGKGTVGSGRLMSLLHTGMIQYKLLGTFVVIIFLAMYFFI
jgi:NADH-quinone oxidoreductase subunit L